MTRRRDFVPFSRAVGQDCVLHGAAFELLMRLILEANYKTGTVQGSGRTIAEKFGMDWKRYMRASTVLVAAGEIEVVKAANQHDDKAHVRVLRYKEWTSTPAGPKATPARHHEDVAGLEVAMNDALIVCVLDRVARLLE